MSKTFRTLLTVLLVLVIVGGMLFLLSWFVPDLRSLAKDLSENEDLPFWIAGLAAPIVYVYRRFTDGIGKLFSSGASQKVEAISSSREDLRKEVDELLQWRRDTLRQEIQSMQATRAEMDSLRTRLSQVQSEMEKVASRTREEKTGAVTQRQTDKPALDGGTFG